MEYREFTQLVERSPDEAHSAANKIIETVEAQPKKIIFGMDESIAMVTNAMFTPVGYTSAEGVKTLGQAHILLEGVPGIGKTDIEKLLGLAVRAKFSRIDGHADLLPRHIIGGEIYSTVLGKFFLEKGPIFGNIVLFDEVNRATPVAHAPFLGAMEERQVVLQRTDLGSGQMPSEIYPLCPIGDTKKLFFWVQASLNPIDKGGEGTFPLSAAQLDRFAFSIPMHYPNRDEEKRIRDTNVYGQKIDKVIDLETVLAISQFVFERMTISPDADEYLQRLIENTRPKKTSPNGSRESASAELCEFVDMNIERGISPRTNFIFTAGARMRAFRRSVTTVTVEDVKAVASMVMRHRLVLTREAKAEGFDFIDDVIKMVLDGTEVYQL